MPRILFALLLWAVASGGYAQAPVWPNPEIEMVYQRGRDAMAQGAIRPAAALFRQVVDAAPEVPEGRRELAGALQLGGAPLEALDVLEPLFKARTADPQAYRIGIAAWKSAGRPDNAENLVKTGLKRHPASGLMHYEAGRWEDGQGKTADALEAWLDGIEADPGYYLNYYEAARGYSDSRKLVWSLLYAETFLLFENQTPRAAETRKLLLATYRRFFFPTAADEKASNSGRRTTRPENFEEAVIYTLRRAAPVVSDGVTTENLTMLRVRFLAEWNETYACKYPYALFAYQDAVLREGHFDAYTMQLLGRAEREAAYDAWVQFHPDALSDYTAWEAKQPFKAAAGGFYNDKKVKGIFLGDNPGKR